MFRIQIELLQEFTRIASLVRHVEETHVKKQIVEYLKRNGIAHSNRIMPKLFANRKRLYNADASSLKKSTESQTKETSPTQSDLVKVSNDDDKKYCCLMCTYQTNRIDSLRRHEKVRESHLSSKRSLFHFTDLLRRRTSFVSLHSSFSRRPKATNSRPIQ